jgi:hypothetical protein
MNSALHKYAGLFFKAAQVGSPAIKIQPGRQELNVAVDILKLWNPNYFMNVSEIVIGPSPNYGYVESGPGKDPAKIYINADRIVAESGSQSGKAAAISAAKTIAHEKGHVESYQHDQFQGGETPAEVEAGKFEQWLQSGGMARVEQLPSYKNLPG